MSYTRLFIGRCSLFTIFAMFSIYIDPVEADAMRDVQINLPSEVDDPCVVPVTVKASPAFEAGESFTLTVGGARAVTTTVEKGRLKQFGYRIRLTNPDIGGYCENCFVSVKPIHSPGTCEKSYRVTDVDDSQIFARLKEGRFMAAIRSGYFRNASYYMAGKQVAANFSSTDFFVKDPNFRIESESTLTGEYCFEITTESLDKHRKCDITDLAEEHQRQRAQEAERARQAQAERERQAESSRFNIGDHVCMSGKYGGLGGAVLFVFGGGANHDEMCGYVENINGSRIQIRISKPLAMGSYKGDAIREGSIIWDNSYLWNRK